MADRDPMQVIADLEALCETATKGPWVAGSVYGRCTVEHKHVGSNCQYRQTGTIADDREVYGGEIELGRPQDDAVPVGGGFFRKQDQLFAARARTALPAALAALRLALPFVHVSWCVATVTGGQDKCSEPGACAGLVAEVLEPLNNQARS